MKTLATHPKNNFTITPSTPPATMPAPLENEIPAHLREGLITRLLKQQSQNRARAIALLAAIICTSGLVDYVTGPHLLMIFFYIIPVVVAVAWFGWRGGNIVAVLCSLTHSVADWFAHTEPYSYTTIWNRVLILAIYLFVSRVVAELLALQRHLEQRVQARTRELEQALAAQVELQSAIANATRYERNAIGRELHDGLGQHLAATNIAAGILAQNLANAALPETAAEARNISDMLVAAIGQTRQIARGLLLATVKPSELDAQIAELCRVSTRKHNIDCSYTRAPAATAARLDDTQASHLFFIAQEALRNALKHANARHIAITLGEDPATGHLALTITDDGRGLPPLPPPPPHPPENPDTPADPDAKPAGLGLRIMQHRATLIGARLDITSPAQDNKGTRIRCAMPFPSI